MAFKKRLATFVSNWFGIIIATIIVAFSAIFGGMYLHAHTRIVDATNYAARVISLQQQNGLIFTEFIEEPPSFIYHITLQTFLPDENIVVNATISNVRLIADIYAFDISPDPDDSWSKSVDGGLDHYTIFEGYLTIDKETFDDLSTKGIISIVVQGQISCSGKYRWAPNTTSFQFNIPIDAQFAYTL